MKRYIFFFSTSIIFTNISGMDSTQVTHQGNSGLSHILSKAKSKPKKDLPFAEKMKTLVAIQYLEKQTIPGDIDLEDGKLTNENFNETINKIYIEQKSRNIRTFGGSAIKALLKDPLIASKIKIWSLRLCNNNLTSIPQEIFQLTTLRKLDVNNNPITEIPAELAMLPKLQYLGMPWDNISSIKLQEADLDQFSEITKREIRDTAERLNIFLE